MKCWWPRRRKEIRKRNLRKMKVMEKSERKRTQTKREKPRNNEESIEKNSQLSSKRNAATINRMRSYINQQNNTHGSFDELRYRSQRSYTFTFNDFYTYIAYTKQYSERRRKKNYFRNREIEIFAFFEKSSSWFRVRMCRSKITNSHNRWEIHRRCFHSYVYANLLTKIWSEYAWNEYKVTIPLLAHMLFVRFFLRIYKSFLREMLSLVTLPQPYK